MDMAQHGVVLAKYVDQGYREDLHKQLADLEVVPQIREVRKIMQNLFTKITICC